MRTCIGCRKASQLSNSPQCLSLELLESRLLLSSSPLHVAGNQLENSLGYAVVLRGVNVNSLEFRPDGDNVLQAESIAINDWHCNLIRVPLNEDFWFGHDQAWTGGESGDGGAAYRTLVGRIVSAAQAANVYVMLDLHWSDMGVWGVGNDGQHFMPDNNSTTFWQSAATIYANNSAVLFDPYNEPSLGAWNQSGGWWDFTPTTADFKLWRDGGTVVEGDVAHNSGTTIGTYNSPGMQGLINTIRATGATNIIAPEGLNWGSDLTGVTAGYALSDPSGNLMYQTHLYPGKDQTSAVAVGASYPIYIGEWGDGGVVGQPSAAATTSNTTMLAFLNTHNYSWTAWDLSPEVGSDLNLLTSWNATATTSDYGALVKADLGQQVALTTPATAVDVIKGQTYRISWTGGTAASVQLWGCGPNGWAQIADNIPSSQGYYNWDTTTAPHGWYYFSAQVNPGSGGAWYTSNSPDWVHVVSPTNHAPTVTLTTSASAAEITKGAAYNITWNASDVDGDTLHIQLWAYSPDTGWFVITGANWLDATAGTFAWDTASQRHGWYSFAAHVWDGSEQGVAASPNWLHIVQPATQMPSFTFTTPTSGQAVAHGSSFSLSWTAGVPAEDAGKMKVQLWVCYVDYKNGNTPIWTQVAANLDPATGSFTWSTTALSTDYQWYSFGAWLGYDDLWISSTSQNWLNVV